MTELVNKLIAYAAGEINNSEAEEIEALLTAYVDGTLNPGLVVLVEQAMEQDQAIASIVGQARFGRHWFEQTLSSELQPCLMASASPELERFVQSLTSDRQTREGNVALFPQRLASWFGEHPWIAVAASIAMVLFAGGGWGLYNVADNRFEDAQIAQDHLEGQFEQISEDHARQASRIAELEDMIHEQQSALQSGVAAKEAVELELADARSALETERSERWDLDARIAELQTELEEAAAQARQNGDLRGAVEEARSLLDQERALAQNQEKTVRTLEERLVKSALVISAMGLETSNLKDRIADLEQTGDARAAFFEEHQRQLAEMTERSADLQVELERAITQVTQLRTERETLQVALAQSGQDSGADWTVQVAQYHSVYAGQSPRHLVEVSADESAHIEKWLSEQLGRSLAIPDLSDSGLAFKGARLLAIKGMPVAQLMYLDREGEPLAICLMRNIKGRAKNFELSEHSELKLIDWKDSAYQYVIVGSEPFPALKALAERLVES